MPVNRLFAILMLIQFVAQHFACCCTGCGNAPQKPVAATNVSRTDNVPCPRRHCCQQHRDRHTQAQSKNTAAPSRNRGDHSQEGSQHHLCFASHIVFNATSRAMVTPSELSSGELILPPDGRCRKLLKSVASCRDLVDMDHVSSHCHERSLLGVYRI